MEKKPMFYGGKVGPWIPVLLMLAGMLASTIIGGGGLNRLTGISFFAISVGFLLCKDKKQFGKITLKGLQNPMLGTILMAYLMAGMLAQLLRQSGLITALIWGISKLGMNAGWIPLIGFIACLLISTSCGTSTGSVAAVAPVLLPLAFSLNIDMGLMCGAIISGAIFGDLRHDDLLLADAGGRRLPGRAHTLPVRGHLRRRRGGSVRRVRPCQGRGRPRRP